MELIITFHGNIAIVEKSQDGELVYRRTMKAAGALVWMFRQDLPWAWVSDNQAIYQEEA